MSNLPKGQCYTGYLFARMDASGEYNICCGSIPIAGSYKEDGRFLKYWKSDKLKKLLYGLKTNLLKYNSMWDNACDDCPHVVSNNEIYDHIEGVRELPSDSVSVKGHGLDLYLESFKSDDFTSINNVYTIDDFTLAPVSFSFEIINSCDHRCNFCWNWSYDMLDNNAQWPDWKSWTKEKISFKIFKETIDDLIELGSPVPLGSGLGGCEDILICGGGEPFLHPQIMDMISHVKHNNFYCQVTTNFSNSVTDERIDELIKLQTNQLIINTSAGTEETYCKTRKVKKSAWDKLLHNLNYISKRKKEVDSVNPEVITKFILTRTNVHEISEMIDLAIKTKADTITFKRFLVNDVYSGKNLTVTDEQYNKFRPILGDKLEQYEFEKIIDYNGMYNFNYVSKKHNVTLRSDITGFFSNS